MQLGTKLLPSLRGRILSIVIFGAILPLALIGWWLSRSAATSGEQRLRAQLDSSLVEIVAAMDARSTFRSADLQLLASNTVVVKMLDRGSPPLDARDSAFLLSLESSMRPTISAVTYRDLRGKVRWKFANASVPREAPASSATEAYADPGVVVTRPVKNAAGEKIGEVAASLRLSALLPVDSVPHVVAGSALRVYDALTGQPVGSARADDAQSKERWISARQSLSALPVTIELAAPASAYLQPFEHAARLGLLTLALVAIFAVLLSAVLASRLTRSLEQLVEVTDAVAGGDINRSVDVIGGTVEITQLASAFNAMTESLRSTLDKLSQRESLAAVGEFAASLSHEVRNALTAIRVDLQRAEEKADDRETSRELLVRALGNVRRLDGVVTGALRFARTGSVPRQEVDLHDVVRTAAQLAQPAMAGTVAVFRQNENDMRKRVAVMGDRIALEQLFLNILLNAGQAMASAGTVNVAIREADGWAAVTIQDTGRGVSAKDLAHLGELFYSPRSDGTGLGVSIARRIATAHGGELNIASNAGAGTTVTVTLPSLRPQDAIVGATGKLEWQVS